MTAPEIADGVQEYHLDSWRDFFQLTTDIFARTSAHIYRGQANWEWKITSRLDRLEKKNPRRKNLSGSVPEFFDVPPFTERQHLDAFRRAIRGRRGPNPAQLDEDACWALGQHYGLATPLLDWTRSPFMALFFAFDEERLPQDDRYMEPGFRAVFALSTSVFEHSGGEPEDVLRFLSPLADDNFRLVSQAALFVRLPRRTDLEAYVRKQFKGDRLRSILAKFRIPNHDRNECLVALGKMGINHMTLFPDISGAARHVNSLWQPGHEDSIAYV